MLLLGEVVAPALPAVAIPILVIALWLIALGLLVAVLYLSHILTWLLSNTVGKLPGVGSILEGLAKSLEATITQTLGSAIGGVDRQIAFWWHTLGDIVSWTYNELRAHANLLETIASVMVGAAGVRLIYKSIHSATAVAHGIAHTATLALHKAVALERALEHPGRGALGTALHGLLKPLTARIGAAEHWIGNTGTTIAGEIDHVIEPDIAALKRRATTLENEAIRVYQDAAGVWHAVNVDAIAAAMVLALPSLGWQWLRCGNVGRAGGALCGLGSSLVTALLGDALTAFAVADICDFTAGVETLGLEIVPLLDGLVDTAEALVGCHGATAPGELGVPALPVLDSGVSLVLAG